MQLKYRLLFVLLLPLIFTNAQNRSKLDSHLQKQLQQGKVHAGNISLLVKGDLTNIKALTKKLGGIYKYGYDDIASVSIPQQNVMEFSSDLAIKKIESTFAKGTFLMDTARIRNNIDSAQWGIAPLHDSVLGKNVIVGIIDGGIYWQHHDFKNADGTTRILYIWDQTVSGNAPLPYLYGAEWNSYQINQGNCGEVESYGQISGCASDFGHGTCVAGITSGNGSSVAGDPFLRGTYTGVAPQSNLIVVNIGTSGTCLPSSVNFLTQISDAVDYIFKKADALGLPCVINTSVGTYYGSHDGGDITTELIEKLLDQRKGRCLVAAGGNAGNIAHHLGYTVSNDTANPTYTLFKYNPNGYVYFDLWADTANFNNVWFTVGATDSRTLPLGQLPYMNVPLNFSNLVDGTPFPINNELYYGNLPLGLVSTTVTLDSARYHIEFEIDNPSNTSYLFSLQTYGAGKFDLWASSSLQGTSDMVTAIDTITFPANYRFPDLNKTIVSSWQCSNKVITVGNYSNRAGYLDVDSAYIDLTAPAYGSEVVGKRFVSSSFGPTRDNRLKPDVMATGSTIICTGDANDIAVTLNPSNRYKVGLGGKHLRNGGTSMAAPVVAGIAALYYQLHPNAGYDEIKRALICTAVLDSFTGPTVGNEYGNGKVNAYQALISTSCISYGATDTSCFNYNALANTDTGGCVAKVYGCMDSSAHNYDSLANISNGSCIYTSIISNVDDGILAMHVMPNPFINKTTFTILNNGYNFKQGFIVITNALGEKIDVISVNPGMANYIYNNTKLAAGVYFYLLKLDNKVVKSGKLVAQ